LSYWHIYPDTRKKLTGEGAKKAGLQNQLTMSQSSELIEDVMIFVVWVDESQCGQATSKTHSLV